MRQTTVERFSDSYYILPEVAIEPYGGDAVIAASDLHRELAMITGYPLMRIAGDHYWLDQEWGVPGDTVAVPKHVELEDDDAVFLTKRRAARRMVDDGIVEAP